jgi:hypothetical protein
VATPDIEELFLRPKWDPMDMVGMSFEETRIFPRQFLSDDGECQESQKKIQGEKG